MRNIYIILLLIKSLSQALSSILLENEYEEKIIFFPIILNFNAFYTNIFFGEPPQKLFLSLDQELQVTWADTIHYKQENSLKSKEINKTAISFRKIELFGKTISDTVILNNNNNNSNISLDDFWFVVIGNSRGYDSRVGGIGLSFKFADEKYSLLHHLKTNNIINQLNYGYIPPSLINNNTEKEGLFFMGGVPKMHILNKYRYNCKVTEKYNFWSCELPYIIFGNITHNKNSNNTLFYENKNYAYFNGAERRILAPEDFMSFLKHNYFRENIINETCKYYLYGMNHVFECICYINDSFPDINFIFDNYLYKFTSEELFQNYGGGNCLFLIQENHLRKNNFIFGTTFLKKFISNFDYETKYITFYSDKKIKKIDLDKFFNRGKKNIYVIALLFLVILVIGILLCVRRIRKYKKYKKDLLLLHNKDKKKIKKMNKDEEGYELK